MKKAKNTKMMAKTAAKKTKMTSASKSVAKKAVKAKTAHKKVSAKENTHDIIELILQDHKPLKALIKIMKNDDRSLSERRQALLEFGPMLLAHAKPEEKALYTYLKSEKELRAEGYESELEHQLATEVLNLANEMPDDDQLSARIKVLAELVEHHIQEEEEDIFPDFKKHSSLEERVEMGEQYLEAQREFEDDSTSLRNEAPANESHLPI